MSRKDIYVSVDIEADGPAPGIHSMLSLGAAAFELGSREPVATYEAVLSPLEGATQHPETMKWWSKFPDAWEYSTTDPRAPEVVIPEFASWAKALPGSPVLVTYPTWDYMWLGYYLARFNDNKTPFGIGSLDIKSLAMAVLHNKSFKATAKRKMPKRWFNGAPAHTHKPLDDAIGQGVLLVNILTEHLGLPQE